MRRSTTSRLPHRRRPAVVRTAASQFGLEALEPRVMLSVDPASLILSPVATAFASLPSAVATGDLNGDGQPDLVVLNDGDNFLGIHLNTGDLADFGESDFNIGLQPNPTSLLLADADGDGHLDILLTHEAQETFETNFVSIYFGNGAGGFASPQFINTGNGPRSVAVGDLDGDTQPDLVVANHFDNTLGVYFGLSGRGFAEPLTLNTGGGPSVVALADFDEDGQTDIVNLNFDSVGIHYNTGEFGFFLADPIDIADPSDLELADLDGSGGIDIVVSRVSAGLVTILLEREGYLPTDYAVGDGPLDVAIGDLNNDGVLDLATTDVFSNTVSVLLGVGDGTFAEAVPQTFNSVDRLLVAPLDASGGPELLVSSYLDDAIYIFRNASLSDTTSPEAQLDLTLSRPELLSGSEEMIFIVHYTDDSAVKYATLGPNNVRVTGPNNFNQLAEFVVADVNANGPDVTAYYVVNAPGGVWDAADVGEYQFFMESVSVTDTSGNFVPGGFLGSLQYTDETTGEPGVDLVGAFTTFTTISPGDTVTVNVYNSGLNAAVGDVRVTFYASSDDTFHSDILLTSVTRSVNIAFGEFESYQFAMPSTMVLPEGQYYIFADIDDTNAVAETDETNNEAITFLNFVGSPLPDLIGFLDLSSESEAVVNPGGALDLTVFNSGSANATGPARLNVFLSTDALLDTGDRMLTSLTPTLNLAPFDSAVFGITLPGDLPLGGYFLITQVDANSQIAESVEDNNILPFFVTIEGGSGGDTGVSKVNFTDSDGTIIALSIPGGGASRVVLTSSGYDIYITNTTLQSKLKIDAKSSGLPGDDGLITIHNLIIGDAGGGGAAPLRVAQDAFGGAADEPASPISKLIAKSARLVGKLDAPGGLLNIQLAELDENAEIIIGDTGNPNDTVTLKFNLVKNASINSAIPIKSLTATRWTNDDDVADLVTAPWIGSVQITGSSAFGLSGDFQAGLNLTGNATGKPTLGKTTIKGTLSDAAWNIAGHTAAIATGAVSNLTADITGNVAGWKSTGGVTGSSLTALSIKKVNIVGNVATSSFTLNQPVDGTLTGTAGFVVKGALSNSTIRAAGSMNKLAFDAIDNSTVFAGVNDGVTALPTAGSEFANAAATIKSLAVKTVGDAGFASSAVAAGVIGKIKLAAVTLDNGEQDFGFAATNIANFARTGATTLKNLTLPEEYGRDGDFVLRVLAV